MLIAKQVCHAVQLCNNSCSVFLRGFFHLTLSIFMRYFSLKQNFCFLVSGATSGITQDVSNSTTAPVEQQYRTVQSTNARLGSLFCSAAVVLSILFAFAIPSRAQLTTLAGSGGTGYTDGTGTSAVFWYPTNACSDGAGNLYVTDRNNNRIRKIVIATGEVTTFAGSGAYGSDDGIGTSAQFSSPSGICYDGAGNLYVSDYVASIRKIVISTGVVTTIAGGTSFGYADGIGSSAQFSHPLGLCLDGAGNLYVADETNHSIRKIVISTGVVTTLAGNGTFGTADGTGTGARFGSPTGICYDGAGNIYVAEQSNNRIRKIVVATGVVTTVAGSTTSGYVDGIGTAARFNQPYGICTDGTTLYVSDYSNHSIRRVIPATGSVTTLAGTQNQVSYTSNACLNGSGNIYIIAQVASVIYKMALPTDVAPTAFSAQSPSTTGVYGTAYTSYTFVANGTPAPTYSLASGSLPPGLTLSAAGVLSGTPTNGGTYNFTVQAANSAGSIVTESISIMVNQIPTMFSAETPPTGVVNTVYPSYTFVANGTPASAYSVASGTLPPGMTLNAAGVLSGTPTAAGTYTFVVQASNALGSVNSNSVIVTIGQAPTAFSAKTPPTSAVAGTAYPSYTFVADGTPAPTYNVASGTLPPGMTLSAAGVLSGTPTAGGTYTFTVRASNFAGSVVTSSISVTVSQAPTAFSAQTPTATRTVSTVYPSYTFVANGTPAPTYSIASGSLPPGLTLSAAGVLSGTPTVTGTYIFTVQASNALGSLNSNSITITIGQAPTAFSAQSPTSAVKGMAYPSYTFVADGYPAPTYSKASGTLPLGLTLSAAGVLSGTPTAVGTYTLTIRASNFVGSVVSSSISITVSQAPTAFTAKTPPASAVIGTVYPPYTFVANGTPAPTYSVASGSLPPGLALSAAGVLSGTPTATGAYTFVIQASNAVGFVNTNSITITIGQAPTAFSAQSPAPINMISTAYPSYTFVADGYPAPTYSKASGTLPPGMTLSAAGVLSGTPTVGGTYTFTVQASNFAGSVVTSSISITIQSLVSTLAASIALPLGVCTDGAGNLYVAARDGQIINKIVLATGVVTTLAGSGYYRSTDGIGTNAEFKNPAAICYDGAGNLYVADYSGHSIRKIVIATGAVTTIAGTGTPGFFDGDGVTTAGYFNGPSGLCVDNAGNLYVADELNGAVRKVDPATGAVSTLASGLAKPVGICTDGSGNLYLTDNTKITKVVIATGVVTTLAGSSTTAGTADGIGTAARFGQTYGICSDGINLYVGDYGNHRIRKIEISTAAVTTLTGSSSGFVDGTLAQGKFNFPAGVCLDGAGNLYVGDSFNYSIRKVVLPIPPPPAEITNTVNAITGINDISLSSLSIYPNPANDAIIISGAGFTEGKTVTIALVNTLGQTVLLLTQPSEAGSSQIRVQVRDLAVGSYTAVLSDGIQRRIIRFMKY